VLTASGYLVARRQAVVSAKIQGRLLDLRVEEGSVVHKGDVLARLESTDYSAQLERSKAALAEFDAQKQQRDAAIQRAEADLAENRRQMSLNARLLKEAVVAQDASPRRSSPRRARTADRSIPSAPARKPI
jgi:multidrug resistance efflux pump